MVTKSTISDPAHIGAIKVGIEAALISLIDLGIKENFFTYHMITNYSYLSNGSHFAAFSEGLAVSDVPAIGSTWRARSYMTPKKPLRL